MLGYLCAYVLRFCWWFRDKYLAPKSAKEKNLDAIEIIILGILIILISVSIGD
jgi:hypothetical protein